MGADTLQGRAGGGRVNPVRVRTDIILTRVQNKQTLTLARRRVNSASALFRFHAKYAVSWRKRREACMDRLMVIAVVVVVEGCGGLKICPPSSAN